MRAIKKGADAKIWTREAVVLAMHEWAYKYDGPPAMPDWDTWKARYVVWRRRTRATLRT